MIAHSQLRRRRGATVAVTLLVGLAGGVVLAAVAGASRTDTSMDRFITYTRPEDVFVIVNGSDGGTPDQVLSARARVLALPRLADSARAPYPLLPPARAVGGVGRRSPFGAADAPASRRMERRLVLQG